MPNPSSSDAGILPPLTLDLFYLGRRDYVNGLTLFEEMLKAFMQSTGSRPEHVHRFQIQKWVRTDAVLECHRTPELRGDRRAREASVRLDLRAGNDQFSLLLFPQPNSPIDSRLDEYDRKAYIESIREKSTGVTDTRLAKVQNMFDLVRGIVEANYQYVLREAATMGIERGVSWAYLNDFPFLTDEQARKSLNLRFDEPKIFDAGGNRYYVRSLSFLALDRCGPAEICYFFALP
jgi:hypothetical protein